MNNAFVLSRQRGSISSLMIREDISTESNKAFRLGSFVITNNNQFRMLSPPEHVPLLSYLF